MPCTTTGEHIEANSPLYYSKCSVGEEETTIVATEQEVMEGGQSWDMTPLIFYRVSKPAKALHTLPCLDLDLFYSRINNEAGEALDLEERVSFTIKKKAI